MDFVCAGPIALLMEDGPDAPVTFAKYPHDPAYVTTVRDRVNALIASAL